MDFRGFFVHKKWFGYAHHKKWFDFAHHEKENSMKKTGYALFMLIILSATQGMADESAEKLDKVLENQSRILAKLDEIKSELGIVKIRASER